MSQTPGGRFSEDDLRRLAALCQESTQRFFEVTLDFTPASLAIADRLISQGLETPEPTLGAVLPWGAYLGEVLVRHAGGRWVLGADPLEIGVALGQGMALPFRRAAERLARGASCSLEAWYREVSGDRGAN